MILYLVDILTGARDILDIRFISHRGFISELVQNTFFEMGGGGGHGGPV